MYDTTSSAHNFDVIDADGEIAYHVVVGLEMTVVKAMDGQELFTVVYDDLF